MGVQLSLLDDPAGLLEMAQLIRRRHRGACSDEAACVVFVGRLIHRRLKDLRLTDQRPQAERWFTGGECEAWCDVTPDVSFDAVMDAAEKALS